jgi:hypothetical protein
MAGARPTPAPALSLLRVIASESVLQCLCNTPSRNRIQQRDLHPVAGWHRFRPVLWVRTLPLVAQIRVRSLGANLGLPIGHSSVTMTSSLRLYTVPPQACPCGQNGEKE